MRSSLFLLILLVAQACTTASEDGEGGSGFGGFLPIIIIMALLWLVLLRPQQRRAKNRREMLSKLEVGDEVLMSSGVYGRIASFDEQTVLVDVADNVRIKVTRDSIAERITYHDWEDESSD
ncbi:MAG: preprotein translocase subunit YajC [bacterium]|nr:preprotein translocase subunit YajC [bacterium]MXZ30131.1 preprotein translocase subunit YajC [Acidimicrobiia bacterium]MDE0668770.1 preprotein translocase subunit YajC [bacterium]MYB23858.1 preprotein translocase subunit YajC [Acidimicrobiia bacterium]MYE68252.1 preprotein translocase subunit YajC [Acidimicrobiia bacterium]